MSAGSPRCRRWLDCALVSERIQRQRTRQSMPDAPADVVQVVAQPATVDYDALLAEIDEVLESDATEYVRSFVQKGGQ